MHTVESDGSLCTKVSRDPVDPPRRGRVVRALALCSPRPQSASRGGDSTLPTAGQATADPQLPPGLQPCTRVRRRPVSTPASTRLSESGILRRRVEEIGASPCIRRLSSSARRSGLRQSELESLPLPTVRNLAVGS